MYEKYQMLANHSNRDRPLDISLSMPMVFASEEHLAEGQFRRI